MNRLEVSAHCKIREGKLEGLKGVAEEFIRQTKEKDTRTLRFDWFLSRDQTECELREEYPDAQGFVEHKTNTAQITQALFAEFATDHHVAVFGHPPPMLVEKVEQTPMGRTVTWFRFLQGLEAEPASYWSGGASSGVKPGLELGAHMTVRPHQAEGFRKQAAELLRLTREKDTRTLRYDWFISRDGTECEVREAYVDGQGLIEHNANVSRARDVFFEQFADNHFMTAYGERTKQLLDLLKATRMEEHCKWFFLLGGLGQPPTTNEPRAFPRPRMAITAGPERGSVR
jgi:quinol monooxygenase YgiN